MRVWQARGCDATITEHTPGAGFDVQVHGRSLIVKPTLSEAKRFAESCFANRRIEWLTA